MKFFESCKTLQELKKEYKRLAMLFHPDRGGDVATMQEINRLYAELFEGMRHNGGAAATGETSETAEAFIKIIDSIIGNANITIELCGSWIWLTGTTFPIKDKLKELGFRWHGKKKSWYWTADGFKKRRFKSLSMDEIRMKYGSEIVYERKARVIE